MMETTQRDAYMSPSERDARDQLRGNLAMLRLGEIAGQATVARDAARAAMTKLDVHFEAVTSERLAFAVVRERLERALTDLDELADSDEFGSCRRDVSREQDR